MAVIGARSARNGVPECKSPGCYPGHRVWPAGTGPADHPFSPDLASVSKRELDIRQLVEGHAGPSGQLDAAIEEQATQGIEVVRVNEKGSAPRIGWKTRQERFQFCISQQFIRRRRILHFQQRRFLQ